MSRYVNSPASQPLGTWVPRIDTPRRVVEQQRSAALIYPARADLEFEALGVFGQFLAVRCSQPAWVSFYCSAQARDGDRSRPLNQDPSPSAGVMLDLLFEQADEQLLMPPGASYYNAANPPQRRLYALLRPQTPGTAVSELSVTAVVLQD
jgi:hypothetical protein